MCNGSEGEVVPIPTLPALVIRIRSVCEPTPAVEELNIIPLYPSIFTVELGKLIPAELLAEPLYILLPNILKLPLTVNLSLGEVVPMPTLPPFK